jgi:hypothetical protein
MSSGEDWRRVAKSQLATASQEVSDSKPPNRGQLSKIARLYFRLGDSEAAIDNLRLLKSTCETDEIASQVFRRLFLDLIQEVNRNDYEQLLSFSKEASENLGIEPATADGIRVQMVSNCAVAGDFGLAEIFLAGFNSPPSVIGGFGARDQPCTMAADVLVGELIRQNEFKSALKVINDFNCESVKEFLSSKAVRISSNDETLIDLLDQELKLTEEKFLSSWNKSKFEAALQNKNFQKAELALGQLENLQHRQVKFFRKRLESSSGKNKAHQASLATNSPFSKWPEIKTLVDAGQLDRAVSISKNWRRDEVRNALNRTTAEVQPIYLIAQGLAKRGSIEHAVSIAQMIEDPYWRSDTFLAIANTQKNVKSWKEFSDLAIESALNVSPGNGRSC